MSLKTLQEDNKLLKKKIKYEIKLNKARKRNKKLRAILGKKRPSFPIPDCLVRPRELKPIQRRRVTSPKKPRVTSRKQAKYNKKRRNTLI